MKITVHQEPRYHYDAIRYMTIALNNSSKKQEINELIATYGTKYKNRLTKAFAPTEAMKKYVKKHINFALPGYEQDGREMAEFLAKARGNRQSTFALACAFVVFPSYETLYTKEAAILTHLYPDSLVDYKNQIPEVADDADFFRQLTSYNLGAEETLDTMHLYYEFDRYARYLELLVADITRIIKEFYPTIQKEMDAHVQFIRTQVDAQGIDFIKDTFGASLGTANYEIYPALTTGMSLGIRPGDWTVHVNLAPYVFTLLELQAMAATEGEGAEQFLKLISDPTKLTILKMLKAQPMYGGQLAEALNCTAANISHHTMPLLEAGLITMEKEGNRIYFNLNGDNIQKNLEGVMGLF